MRCEIAICGSEEITEIEVELTQQEYLFMVDLCAKSKRVCLCANNGNYQDRRRKGAINYANDRH